jgi:hypothetical protein
VALNISEVQWKPDSPGCEERPDCGMLYNTIIVRGARILSIIYFNISIVAIKTTNIFEITNIFQKLKVWVVSVMRNPVFLMLWNSERGCKRNRVACIWKGTT